MILIATQICKFFKIYNIVLNYTYRRTSEFLNFMKIYDYTDFDELKEELSRPPNNFRIQQNNDLFLCRYKTNKHGNKNIITTDLSHPL